MTDQLAKAELRQLDVLDVAKRIPREIEPQTWCTVQFNPESLKVSFANHIEKPPGSGDQRGSAPLQFVGTATTKLTLMLWFDVGSPQPPPPPGPSVTDVNKPVTDVRKLTKRVAFFIKPKGDSGSKSSSEPKQLPIVRFLWGSFQFDGIVESLEETLEFFSPEGEPLRASVSLSISRQAFQFSFRDTGDGTPAGGPQGTGATPGTQPMARASEGSTVQGLADAAGIEDWQPIAVANDIENPRLLAPGQLLNLNAPPSGLGMF